MLGDSRNPHTLMFTKDEVMRATSFMTFEESSFITDFFDSNIKKYRERHWDGLAFQMALIAVFEAGRIQGYREMRAKKKAKPTV